MAAPISGFASTTTNTNFTANEMMLESGSMGTLGILFIVLRVPRLHSSAYIQHTAS
jgi:hypothetical protein